MPETNQTGSKTPRQATGNGGTGAQEKQQVAQSTSQQGGQIVREESGRENRSLRRQGSRQLATTSQNPFAMARQLSREMDRMMDSFFDRGFGSLLRDMPRDDDWSSSPLWTPQIDVQQRNDSIVVHADLPGLRKGDVQIEVDDDALVIFGQRREERDEDSEDQGYRVFER